jgi:hypothetical protein
MKTLPGDVAIRVVNLAGFSPMSARMSAVSLILEITAEISARRNDTEHTSM